MVHVLQYFFKRARALIRKQHQLNYLPTKFLPVKVCYIIPVNQLYLLTLNPSFWADFFFLDITTKFSVAVQPIDFST